MTVVGNKVYQLTTTYDPGSVTGDVYKRQDLSDNLVNLSNELQEIRYTFKARIRDIRPGSPYGYCDQGKDTTIKMCIRDRFNDCSW